MDVLDTLPAERRLDEACTRQLKENLAQAGLALGEARKLAGMLEGRYPITWSDDVDSTPCPWFDAFYATKALLQHDALLHNQAGDVDAALVSHRALFNVGRSLGDEPFFHGQLSRLGCRFNAVAAIERTLAQGQPSEAALAAIQEAVRQEETVTQCLPYFRGHRAMMHRFLTEVDDGNHRLSELGCGPTPGWWRAHAETWLYRGSAIRTHARYLRAMNEAVAIAGLPLEEQFPRYKLWRKEYGHVENVGDGLTFGQGTEFALLAGHAGLRCASVGLAAERYRKRHGGWPPSLGDLVPHYLTAVPLDPFDGKPLRYRRTEHGAVIYSIGEDAHDDGGDPNRASAGRRPRDVVFTLWNVDQRRQPPKPAAPPRPQRDDGRD